MQYLYLARNLVSFFPILARKKSSSASSPLAAHTPAGCAPTQEFRDAAGEMSRNQRSSNEASIIAPPKTGAASGVTGAYTKCGQIGKGSFGVVFLVRHTKKGGETLICKEVQTKGMSSGEIKATKQEIAVLKHMRHRHIIGYHSTFESENGLVCILMEYAAGGDLGRLIARRAKENDSFAARFAESEIKKYALQLGSALEYLHSDVHLLHRDVKPKNVFLAGDGDVRLGDFGLSKVLSKTDGTSETRVGTPLYMSPELAAGAPYDRSADVWAFGCTLYECMSFKPPWNELCTPDGGLEGGMAGLTRALNHSSLSLAPLQSFYSANLLETLKSLLAKRKDQRMTLSALIAQLTEAPKIPASWGLSADAQAALEALNAQDAERTPTPPPVVRGPRRNGAGGKGGKEAKPAAPTPPLWRRPLIECVDIVDDEEEGEEEEACGIEQHAAAGVLQRSFRVANSHSKMRKAVAFRSRVAGDSLPLAGAPAAQLPPGHPNERKTSNEKSPPPTVRPPPSGLAAGKDHGKDGAPSGRARRLSDTKPPAPRKPALKPSAAIDHPKLPRAASPRPTSANSARPASPRPSHRGDRRISSPRLERRPSSPGRARPASPRGGGAAERGRRPSSAKTAGVR